MLLPTTYALQPVSALIMLAGIYYGAQYGGSTTAILRQHAGRVVVGRDLLDGYQMARKGRAGAGARHRGARLVLRRLRRHADRRRRSRRRWPSSRSSSARPNTSR